MESAERRLGGDKDVASTDGGDSYGVYEVGSDLVLNPLSDEGLVRYWKLEESSGNFADSSGNGGTGTAAGTLTYRASAKVNYGIDLDATDSGFSGGAATPGAFTIAGWFFVPSNTENGAYLFTRGGYANALYQSATRRVLIYFERAAGGGYSYTPTAALTLGIWNFIAYGVDQTGLLLRSDINGIVQDTVISSDMHANDFAATFSFGYRGGATTDLVGGSLDDVRLYNRALSAAEMESIRLATQ